MRAILFNSNSSIYVLTSAALERGCSIWANHAHTAVNARYGIIRARSASLSQRTPLMRFDPMFVPGMSLAAQEAVVLRRVLRLDQDIPSGVPMSLKRLPDGQITEMPVQPFSQKDFGVLFTQITSTSIVIPAYTEGRFAIVTNVGQGMRWTQAAPKTRALFCGRRSRVVLTPRRWRQVGGGDSTGDGGKQARSPGRARNKP